MQNYNFTIGMDNIIAHCSVNSQGYIIIVTKNDKITEEYCSGNNKLDSGIQQTVKPGSKYAIAIPDLILFCLDTAKSMIGLI